MTDNQAEMEFEDGVDNVKISGLKFFTANDGQHTIPELLKMTELSYQKVDEEIDLLMIGDSSVPYSTEVDDKTFDKE
ncbi:hypothetical protein IR084_00550 [Streptococcus danieliae]|uniref:Uncharacterized protein n=2 Tax=Streptococcus danieliae TaxID=747656 RepID=A0A7Z0M4G0_9STRE|nr:hypothetical protein [Streptococcus danieliae]NYS95707.1 hypothetical protein [Streptococcus danieliae]